MIATSPEADGVGALLTRVRHERGMSQRRLADALCAASDAATVSRHEVSRWERGDRIPTPFWLGWLAEVLDVPLDRLERATACSRDDRSRSGVTRVRRSSPPVRWYQSAPAVHSVIAGAGGSEPASAWPWRILRARPVVDASGRLTLRPVTATGALDDPDDRGPREPSARLAALR